MILGDLITGVAAAAEQALPRDGWGLLGLLVLGLPSIIAAAGTAWVLVRQRKNANSIQGSVAKVQEGVSETKRQVVNGHPDPLRVDLDRQFAELGGKVDGLATAVAVEQAQRREANRSIGARLDSIEAHLRSK